jgi:acyl-coenzyme A synthetase/AMP-(fatty) acid ligase
MNDIRDLGVTILCQAPTEYRIEAKLENLASWKMPQLRHCVSAGEPLNPEVLARWKDATGLTILDGYGQTENSLIIANVPGMPVRPGSMGKPTPGHDIEVVDEDGDPCAIDVVGDIGLRGNPPTLFAGYYKNDEETAASRRGEWYLTGDRARKDADGYFWFVGRADDVISSGAYRIGPFEVESALLEHPAVAESAVVGSPNPDRGNIVKAFVVLRPGVAASGALAAELQEHCKRVTAPYKYPREIEFVAALPKTASGKIRRVELRAAELAKKGATAASGFV